MIIWILCNEINEDIQQIPLQFRNVYLNKEFTFFVLFTDNQPNDVYIGSRNQLLLFKFDHTSFEKNIHIF
jgi:hypothetical protein